MHRQLKAGVKIKGNHLISAKQHPRKQYQIQNHQYVHKAAFAKRRAILTISG